MLPAALVASLCALAASQAQDKVFFTNGTMREGKVAGVSGASLQLQIGAGAIGLPLATVARVEMVPPPGVAEAEKAFGAGDFSKALVAAKGVAEKFAGLPADWAKRCALMVAECHIEMNDLAKAEAALASFQKTYPGQGSAMADVGAAMIAFAKNDLAGAKAKLEPIAAEALKTFRPDEALGRVYGRVFLTLGKIAEGEGNYSEALANYLRTVTLFYQDPQALAAATERAAAVRKEHGATAP